MQWALELSTHAFLADPANAKAKEFRTQALLGLAAQQTSAIGRNYLLTYLLEDHGVTPKRYPVAQNVLNIPLESVFKRMAFSVKAEDVEDVRMTGDEVQGPGQDLFIVHQELCAGSRCHCIM